MASSATIEPPDAPVPDAPFRGQPPHRQRVADHVFESLARAILTGELKPGQPVPTQRDLARQFNVSALVVRQAIHRLEDLSLVRVRQGSTTVVLDPNESTDIRLIQLQMELSDPGPALAAAAFENQSLFLIQLLVLAERRITEKELGVLNYLLEQAALDTSGETTRKFRPAFWQQIAKATRNPLFQQQVRWWGSLAAELQRRGIASRAPLGALDLAFYHRIVDALAAHHGAVDIYLESVKPLLDWVEAKRGMSNSKPG